MEQSCLDFYASLDCPLHSQNPLPCNLLKSKHTQKRLVPPLAFVPRKPHQCKRCLGIVFSFGKTQIHSNVNHIQHASGTPAFFSTVSVQRKPITSASSTVSLHPLPPLGFSLSWNSSQAVLLTVQHCTIYKQLLHQLFIWSSSYQNFFLSVFKSRDYVPVWQRGIRFCLCRLNIMVMHSCWVFSPSRYL